MTRPTELQDYLIDCTVRVETGSVRGTGFFIAPGLVMTCAHIIEDPVQGDYPFLSVIDVAWKGRRYPARIVRYAASPSPDLAVLRADVADHPCAYLFDAIRPDDPLYACGFPPGPVAHAARVLFEGAEPAGAVLKLRSRQGLPDLDGAPLLNLRTGGVCAILKTKASGGLGGPARATPISVATRLFPGIKESHDLYHEERPEWFHCSGIVGTVFAARALLGATRAACQKPVQPLLAPDRPIGIRELLAPVTFRTAGAEGQTDEPLDTMDLLDRSREARTGFLLVGPAGSGRSSALRLLGQAATASCRNLGAQDQDCVFPILLRANQLTAEGGPVEEQILDAIGKTNGPAPKAPLPSSLLTDLADSSGLRLLVMIDGIDEIQNTRDLAELVDLIGRIQKHPGFGPKAQLVATCRPATVEHFRYSGFEVYEIRPLDRESIGIAAERWLGKPADAFLSANRHLVDRGVLASPLVLSVALKLFERRGGTLPGRVVELYRDLFEECAADWRRRGLDREYGAEIIDNAPEIFGFLALEMMRAVAALDPVWVRGTAARYFQAQGGRAAHRAEDLSRRFISFAAADSLFLRLAGDRFYWSHQSFRDYFAASLLVRTPFEDGQVIKEIKGRWFDANWGKTPSFAIALLPDPEERERITREILASGREERLEFVAGLLRDGVELPQDISDAVAGRLS